MYIVVIASVLVLGGEGVSERESVCVCQGKLNYANLSDISNLCFINVTVYRKTGHNAACVNIEKRSINFLKMYCFKPTEGNS